ncbi:MAG: hypothetical protein R3311_21500, partial [Oceanisphaera sp.]|nr:hypothetical protein [Oceanisphaera sp.]
MRPPFGFMNETELAQEYSFLHRLDARLKVPLCLGLVVLAFAAHSWLALLLVVLATLFLAAVSRA